VPSDAVSARFRVEASETVSHSASNSVSIYGAKLVDQPIVVGPGLLLADSGVISVTPSGTSNNYDPGNIDILTLLQAACTAAWIVTGLKAPTAKFRLVYLMNYSAFTITLKEENVGSLAANRFNLPGSVDYVLNKNAGCLLIYNIASSRWLILTGNS
jgi:hypothetical protein